MSHENEPRWMYRLKLMGEIIIISMVGFTAIGCAILLLT